MSSSNVTLKKATNTVVARDGIEPPTQAFSGLVLREPGYMAHVKSRFINSQDKYFLYECDHFAIVINY